MYHFVYFIHALTNLNNLFKFRTKNTLSIILPIFYVLVMTDHYTKASNLLYHGSND